MTTQVTIENPIINSPFKEPARHFKFSEDGITNEILEQRRPSSYFIPVPKSKKSSKSEQLNLPGSEWTEDRLEENKAINEIRQRVKAWRGNGRPGITRTTASLLEFWTKEDRFRKLFFCQLEALETVIYLFEAAEKHGDQWILNRLKDVNEQSGSNLFRIAFKMATGSGKTVVMAMLIAWQALNKIANTQDARFSDTFILVAPGITIRDRLRVLLPSDPDNYYRKHEIVSHEMLEKLKQVKIVITNFHQMKLRDKMEAGRLTKIILRKDGENPFIETPDQMVRRVCRGLGNKKNIIVINDEAHHCYRKKPGEEIDLKGEEKKEAEKRDEEARVWINGLEAINSKIGVKAVFDLSATPFFLKGSGYPEGTLFPWVVSDFSLIDAIESGIVKIPRVPVSDDSMTGDLPTYRDIWTRIRDHLPKKGRGTESYGAEPKLPKELQGALHSLYDNYLKYHERWHANIDAKNRGTTPPVFIIVCNNTNVSKMIFDYVAGWEKKISDEKIVVVPGELPLFSNEQNSGWTARPNTLLIDSEQLESGEGMSAEFKQMAIKEIEEFKTEYRQRFPDRDVEKLTDEDILREVMNTVGKPGKLGEHIKCVISVSMLTEGWDANTVTHVLGVRAFGTQLLCEQVVGRGLRRMSYAVNDEGMFIPEYAEIYGVPFSFIPCSGSTVEPPPPKPTTRVRALEDRKDRMIRFPRVAGYRYELPAEILNAVFNDSSHLVLSTESLPTKVSVEPIVGEKEVHTLDNLKLKRENEVAFHLTRKLLSKYFRDDEGTEKHWLFPTLLVITKEWMSKCIQYKDNTFIQMLLISEFCYEAIDKIYRSIVAADPGEKRLKPILFDYDEEGTTQYVDFDTTKPTYATAQDKCHISHVVADTDSWEQKAAQSLESMPEVYSYVKNHNLGFFIPYTLNGEERKYYPDFIVRVNDGKGENDRLNLIIEVTGEKKKDKEAKTATAQTLWIPAINNAKSFGRWSFIEIRDPWDIANAVKKGISHA